MTLCFVKIKYQRFNVYPLSIWHTLNMSSLIMKFLIFDVKLKTEACSSNDKKNNQRVDMIAYAIRHTSVLRRLHQSQ
jgi:hypothetical protein